MSKKFIAVTIIILVILAGLVVYFIAFRDSSNNTTNTTEELNLNPPTEEEKAQADKQKEEIEKREETIKDNQPSDGQKRSVKPQITYADDYGQDIEVAAVVNGVFESNATCKAVLKQGSSVIEKSVSAVKSSSSMSCPTIRIPQSEFAATGTWQVTVEYNSTTATGVSDMTNVEVR